MTRLVAAALAALVAVVVAYVQAVLVLALKRVRNRALVARGAPAFKDAIFAPVPAPAAICGAIVAAVVPLPLTVRVALGGLAFFALTMPIVAIVIARQALSRS